jgi:hypothetical protein
MSNVRSNTTSRNHGISVIQGLAISAAFFVVMELFPLKIVGITWHAFWWGAVLTGITLLFLTATMAAMELPRNESDFNGVAIATMAIAGVALLTSGGVALAITDSPSIMQDMAVVAIIFFGIALAAVLSLLFCRDANRGRARTNGGERGRKK